MDLTGIALYIVGTIAVWLFSRFKINGIREESEARIKSITSEANANAEARADKQRSDAFDYFREQTARLESKLEKVSSESAAKYEQLNAEYTRTITSNAHMQGQLDIMRVEQVEAAKRSQSRDQLLGKQEAQLLEANKQIDLQSRRLGELESELTKTRASEASAIETAEGYRQELDKAQEALSDLKRQVEELKTQVEELTQEVHRLRTELNIVKAERDRLHEENARLNALLNPPNAPAIDSDLGKTQRVDVAGIATGPFTESIADDSGLILSSGTIAPAGASV